MAETQPHNAEPAKHYPVMLSEIITALNVSDDKNYIDATFGAGGYSKAILNAANSNVIAIDRDPYTKTFADEVKQKYGDRFSFMQGEFGQINNLLLDKNTPQIDGIVFDIGVSSMQIDDAERGFSFKQDAPLDMRMSCEGISAFDVVNNMAEDELADIIYNYGEERASRWIAKAIGNARIEQPIATTCELADIIRRAVRSHSKGKANEKKDLATRTFQAIRIYVNNELEEIETRTGSR